MWLANESDAGCISLTCSHLDVGLSGLHKRLIAINILSKTGKLPSKGFLNHLTDSDNSALYGFARKIRLAYCYGIISEADYNSLNALRDIRNEASHCTFQFHLSDRGLKPFLERVLNHKAILKTRETMPALGAGWPSKEKSIVIAAAMAFTNLFTAMNRKFDARINKGLKKKPSLSRVTA